jgi:hypothetical protein
MNAKLVARSAVFAVSIICAATRLQAQAVCSAPHSGPVISNGAQAGTLEPFTGWFQLSIARQDTRTIYQHDRVARPLILDGEATTTSVYASASIGVLEGVEIWAQIPFHALSYTDNGGSRERSGIGDPRFSVRLSPAVAGFNAVPVVLRAGVKLPGERFPVDATVIPLTEGQRDWELSIESWRTFAGGRTYVLGWAGYRWRETNRDAARRPGNEVFIHGAVGGPLGERLHWELGGDVLRGGAPEQQRVILEASRRELAQVQPTLSWNVGPGRVGLSAQIPLQGRNLPASPGFSLGYLMLWSAR